MIYSIFGSKKYIWMGNVSKINSNWFWMDRRNNNSYKVSSDKGSDEENDKGYIVKVDNKYPKRLHNLHSELSFFQKELKLINIINMYAICSIKRPLFTKEH